MKNSWEAYGTTAHEGRGRHAPGDGSRAASFRHPPWKFLLDLRPQGCVTTVDHIGGAAVCLRSAACRGAWGGSPASTGVCPPPVAAKEDTLERRRRTLGCSHIGTRDGGGVGWPQGPAHAHHKSTATPDEGWQRCPTSGQWLTRPAGDPPPAAGVAGPGRMPITSTPTRGEVHRRSTGTRDGAQAPCQYCQQAHACSRQCRTLWQASLPRH